MHAQADTSLLSETPARLLSREARDARRFYRLDGALTAGGWRVVAAGWETLAAGAYAQERDFPYHKIEFVLGGRGWVELGGLRQALTLGTVFAVAPDARVGVRSDATRPLRRAYLWLDGAGARAAVDRAGLPAGRVRVVATPGEIRAGWDWLLREGASPRPNGAELASALAAVVLLKLADGLQAGATLQPEGARESFERCRALVDTDAGRLRGAAELAAAAGLRVETVCRLFRRYLDTTPGDYLRTRRMRLAAERLRLPDARVKEVAAELGFADAFHFSRVFKAEMGVSPREWRGRAG